MSQVKKELEQLVDMANDAGDNDMASFFSGQLSEIGEAGRKRARRGGKVDLCHAITTAMLLSSGAAITYLAQLSVIPSIMKLVPQPCDGFWARGLSWGLGWFDDSYSCVTRQAKWSDFVKHVMETVFNQPVAQIGLSGLLPLIVSNYGRGKDAMKSAYMKLYEYNKEHVCAEVKEAKEHIEAGECPKGTGADSKSPSGQKSKTRKRTRAKSDEALAPWEMMYGYASDVAEDDEEEDDETKPAKQPSPKRSPGQLDIRTFMKKRPTKKDDIRSYFDVDEKKKKAKEEAKKEKEKEKEEEKKGGRRKRSRKARTGGKSSRRKQTRKATKGGRKARKHQVSRRMRR